MLTERFHITPAAGERAEEQPPARLKRHPRGVAVTELTHNAHHAGTSDAAAAGFASVKVCHGVNAATSAALARQSPAGEQRS